MTSEKGHAAAEVAVGFGQSMIRLTALGQQIADDRTASQAVLGEMRRLVGADWVAVFLLHATVGGLALLDEIGEAPPYDLGGEARNILFDRPSSILITTQSPVSERGARLLARLGVEWAICAPFLVTPGVQGALVAVARGPATISAGWLPYVDAYAGILALLMRGAQRSPAGAGVIDARRLLQISQDLTAAGLEDVAPRAARSIADFLETAVAIYEAVDDELHVAGVAAPTETGQQRAEFKAGYLLRVSGSPIRRLVEEVRPGADLKALRVDVTENEAFTPLRDLACSEIRVVPLVIGGQPLGAIATFHDPGAVPAEIDATLPQIAYSITPAIHGSILRREMRARIRESEAEHRISHMAWLAEDPEESLDVLAQSMKLLFDADYVAFIEITGDTATWTHAIGAAIPTPPESIRRVPNDWFRERIARLETGVIRELGVDPPVPAMAFPVLHREGLVSAIFVPFGLMGAMRGSVVLGYRMRREITSGDIRFARSLAQGVAAALMMRRIDAHARAALEPE